MSFNKHWRRTLTNLETTTTQTPVAEEETGGEQGAPPPTGPGSVDQNKLFCLINSLYTRI